MTNIPADLRYTKNHEWIKPEGGNMALIGITDYAQGELGDIVFVEIETQGRQLARDEVFGTIEAVKTVSDLFMPVGGKVVAVNDALQDIAEVINKDPYGKGWLIKIEMTDPAQVEALLDAAAYQSLIDA